jgi:serine phosphatase RsbU (regulator of sigma subunit)
MREASPAFRQALLKSEKKRIVAVVAFVAFFVVLAMVRIFVFKSSMSHWGLPLAALMIAWELGLLRAVDRSLKSGRDIPLSIWYFTIALESLFPAIGVAFLTSTHLLPEYRPVATPWALAFFPFILLSVLRLSPNLSCISGAVSCFGYLGAAYYVGWHFTPGPDGHSVTQTAVPYFALLLLITGVIAGAVAGEIRTYVEDALREAETRHQLQQVEHDLQIAKSVQQSLLPKTRPEIPGFQIAGWNQSADDTGGDFYDWKRLPNGRWVIVLADVTGHGIGPAILASVCRAYSRASFNEHDNLETTLKNINQSFAGDVTPGRFATFVAAVFEEGGNHVELLSAGHGPLFVYSSQTRSCQLLNAQALPLGLMPDLGEALPVKIDMKPGDMVLLITDGFAEWENKTGEQFGAERLAELVGHFSDREPEIIIAELYDAVLKFTDGTPQSDDLTAVLIKCAEKEAGLVKASAAD